MNIQKIQNVTFGARVNVNYSTKSGEMKPAAEKLATYLRKIGDNSVRDEITVRNRYISVKSLLDREGEDSLRIGSFTVKGKKALDGGFLLRLAKAKTYLKNIKAGGWITVEL